MPTAPDVADLPDAGSEVLRRAGSISLTVLLILIAPALAQSPTTVPASHLALLQQLNTETQTLYTTVRPSLVRVELPPPKWLAQLSGVENPALKWSGRLDDQMQAELHALQQSLEAGHPPAVQASIATSQPTTAPTESHTADSHAAESHTAESHTADSHTARTLLVPRPDGGYDFITSGAQPSDTEVTIPLTPRVQGICLDDSGHVLIPICIDEEAMKDRTVAVIGADGKTARASFVGSDRQTNLTVLKLDHPSGNPANLTGTRPADGSLVMMLSPNGESGRLCVWTGGQQDRGLVITADGAISGFVRFGQFLSADSMRPLAQQIIQSGKVRRATLGVLVSQAEAPDGRHAIHIERVLENSPAAAAGLRDGDFILSLAGALVTDVPSFAAAIAMRNGSTELQILRDGKPATVTADLHPQ